MALIRKVYSARKYGKSWINVGVTGVITFSQRLTMSLNIEHGDFIAFYQDEFDNKNWFVKKEEDGLRVNLANKNYFKVNSKSVAQDILLSIGATKSVKINVSPAKDKNGMFAVITSSATDMRGNKIK